MKEMGGERGRRWTNEQPAKQKKSYFLPETHLPVLILRRK
jgi:hypothetical protein